MIDIISNHALQVTLGIALLWNVKDFFAENHFLAGRIVAIILILKGVFSLLRFTNISERQLAYLAVGANYVTMALTLVAIYLIMKRGRHLNI